MSNCLTYSKHLLRHSSFMKFNVVRMFGTGYLFRGLGLPSSNSSGSETLLQMKRHDFGLFLTDGWRRYLSRPSLGNIQKSFLSTMPNAAEEFRHLDYAQLTQKLKSNDSYILIDVREKSELEETGTIPGAHHIPVGEIETALLKTEDDFKKTYNFPKPSEDDQIIFSCRSGKRSLMALEKALAKGFINCRHYKGGWLDWESNSTS